MKITNLPAAAALTGLETLPVVQDGQSRQSTLGQMVDASFGPLASALAVALGNYRPTLAEAVAQLAVGAMFASDESGALCLYRRISGAPGYALYDTALTSGLLDKRTALLPNFAAIAARRFDASVTMLTTAAHSLTGIGGAAYVSDALATSDLAAAYPLLCARSLDGRYWRAITAGRVLGFEQAGVIANDTAKAAANVTALAKALAYLGTVCGGGVMLAGAGTFTFDAAAIGAGGITIPPGVTLRGVRGATILQSTDRAFTGNPLLSCNGGVAWIEELTLRGRAVYSNMSGGGMRRVRIEGNLSETQYIRIAADFAGAFAAPTFSDGAGGVPAADYTWAMAGSVGTMTLSNSVSLLGNSVYYRYARSGAVPLDPTKRYVIRFLDGFYTGAGAAEPQITLYDADGNPLDAKQKLIPYAGAAVANVHKPQNDAMYVGTGAGGADEAGAWQVAYITGASSLKLAVGAFRHYSTVPGLAASFDFSKIEVLQLVNNFAAYSLSSLPTNAACIQFSACANVEMSDCVAYGVEGRVGLLFNSTNSVIHDNLVTFSTHGFADDTGDGNSIYANVIDQRFRGDDGALRGMRPYRWKGIGGSNVTRGRYYDNRIIGASWGVEILPYGTARTNWVYGNEVWAEFAAFSLGNGRFFVANNRAHLASDGLFGFELPGSTDAAQYLHANVENNFVEWSDFSGYNGFGYSCSIYRDIKIKGGFTRAPYLVQGVSGQTGATLLIDGMDGQYGVAALLGRGPSGSTANSLTFQTRWGKIEPYKVCFPYGVGASDAIIDVSISAGTGHLCSIAAERVSVGGGRYVQLTGLADMEIDLREVRNPSLYRTSGPLFITTPAAEPMNLRLVGNDFIKPNSSMSTSGWCQISGTPYTGSSMLMRGNKWGQESTMAPSGTYPRSMLRGDPWLVAYKASTAIGTLAAGATLDIPVSIAGLAATDQAFDLETYTAGGLDGLAWSCWATGDDTATLRLRNITGASTNFGTQTLRITARRTV
ncbi:NosD domain-containing protein [Novosphingobium humi]|uniref:NosD domain-containing protein n=1 Tax=Novosphingobium humi TaxID=2282397 RepID=UPI0025AFDCE7|nr:NosD domain-containing protein [Novosphingobium humi]WJS98205.1 hypothetical protein NYQ05_13880 [Novosphingobium humi]